MSKLYTTNTAALRAVTIDSNTINTKKLMIYPGTGERTERKDIIEIIDDAINGTLTEELTFNTNTVGGTLDNATVKGIQYSKAHFISDGYITSIAIPYNYKSDDGNSGYLYIEAINEDGNVVNSGYSIEPSSFNDSSSGEHITTFNFNNFYIPENYKLVRLALVPDKTTTPNIVTTENCLAFRSRPIKLNNNVNYDDDDCIVYISATKTQNWVIELTVTYNQVTGGVIDDIYYNDIRINRLLNDISNLTANSQTYITSEDAQLLFANKETVGDLQSKNYAYTDAENVFSSANTFEAPIQTNNIVVDGGSLTFTDTIDGTVIDTINPNASGYRYIPEIPSSFDNGVCYDIGEISDSTDLSLVRFSAEGRLVQTCELWFRTSATPSTKHKWPTGIYWIDSNTGAAPTLLASKNYRLVFRQEPNKIIASIAYLY
jgi:hypothetical protein